MKLKSVQLSNFRCFADELVEFDNYTSLVGANNAGKSALLGAIDIFFRSNPKSIPITKDDFYKRLVDRTLEIRLTFCDLTAEELEDFSHYARGGELTFFISSTCSEGVVRSSIHGSRFSNPDFAGFFELNTAADKRVFYEKLSPQYSLPPWRSQGTAEQNLRDFEEKFPDANVPLKSGANAFGVEGPIPRINKYIDFVYVPAVKDASEEAVEARNSAFSKLIERAVRAQLNVDEKLAAIRLAAKNDIDQLSTDHQEALTELSKSIAREYRRFSSTESQVHLDWGKFNERSLEINLPPVRLEMSDDLVRNTIGKFGHGTQRNYIMAVLLVSATHDFSNLKTLILGCEEPELYQHPPQAKQFASALQLLADGTAQVIVSTHSPFFISAKRFDSIRVVRRSFGDKSRVYRWSIDEHCALIARAKNETPLPIAAGRAALNQFMQPQMNEMFFARGVVFVEGEEDKAIISRAFLISLNSKALIDCGVDIVSVNGKGNMINAISVARGFEIPFYAVFDGDMNCRPDDMQRNLKLNADLLSLLSEEFIASDGRIDETKWGATFCVWQNSIDEAFEDLSVWRKSKKDVAEEFGWTLDRLKKNAIVLDVAMQRIMPTLTPKFEHLCDSVVNSIGRPHFPISHAEPDRDIEAVFETDD